MPSYPWSCLSCGSSNASHAEACCLCNCPACATSKQVDSSRANHLARGGQVQQASAADEAPSLSAVDVLVRLVMFMLSGRLLPPPKDRQIP